MVTQDALVEIQKQVPRSDMHEYNVSITISIYAFVACIFVKFVKSWPRYPLNGPYMTSYLEPCSLSSFMFVSLLGNLG